MRDDFLGKASLALFHFYLGPTHQYNLKKDLFNESLGLATTYYQVLIIMKMHLQSFTSYLQKDWADLKYYYSNLVESYISFSFVLIFPLSEFMAAFSWLWLKNHCLYYMEKDLLLSLILKISFVCFQKSIFMS